MATAFAFRATIFASLEELKVPPASLLPRAGLPATLFQQDKVQVSTEEMFAIYRAMSEVSGDPGYRIEDWDRRARRTIRSHRHRGALHAIFARRLAAPGALQAADLPGENRSHRERATNARCASIGCWRKSRSQPRWSTPVLPGSSPLRAAARVSRCIPSASSSGGRSHIARSTKTIFVAR